MRINVRVLMCGFLSLFLSCSFAFGATTSICDGKKFVFDKDSGSVDFDGTHYYRPSMTDGTITKFGDGLGLISEIFLGDKVTPGSLEEGGEIAFLRSTTLYIDKGLKGDRVDADLITVGVISLKKETESRTYLCKKT